MRLHQVRLNPSKCAFSVQVGKHSGYMVCYRGIEFNIEKFDAIEGMKILTYHKEV